MWLVAVAIGSIGRDGSSGRGSSLAVRCCVGGGGAVSATCRPYWPWRRIVAVAELALSAAAVRGHAVAGQPTLAAITSVLPRRSCSSGSWLYRPRWIVGMGITDNYLDSNNKY